MRDRELWKGSVLAVWALMVFIRYFLGGTHPIAGSLHFIPDLFRGDGNGAFHPEELVRSCAVLLSTLGMAVLIWALGRATRRWMGELHADPWTLSGLDLGLGILVLGLWTLGTGMTGLWFRSLWWAWLLGLLAWSLFDLWRNRPDLRFFSNAGKPEPVLWPLLGLGILWGLYSFLQSLLPETFYDSMVYHLAVPEDWMAAHGFRDLPGILFSHFPYGGESFLWNGWILAGTEGAKALHVLAWVAVSFLLAGWSREMGGAARGWLALGLVSTLPLATVCAWSTAIEGILALALSLCVYAVYRFLQGGAGSHPWALVSGLFAGAALGVKYTGAVVLAVLFFLSVLRLFREKKKGLAAFVGSWSLGGTLFLLPWWSKNLAFTANPFFPYLSHSIGDRTLEVPGLSRLIREQQGWVTGNPWESWKLPWTLTMGDPNSYNFVGPLSLALLPLLFLFWPKDRDRRFLAWLFLVSLGCGLCLSHILRFSIFPFLFLGFLLTVLPAPWEEKGWLRAVGSYAALTALAATVFLGAISFFYYRGTGVWTAQESRTEYLMAPNKITPYMPLVEWVRDHCPADARLLLVGDARGLYYGRSFLSNSVFDAQELARLARSEKDAEGIRKRLREDGVDYLVVNGEEGVRVAADYGHYELGPEEWRRLDDFIQRYTEPVFPRSLQGIYRLLPAPKPATGPQTFDLILFFSGPASRFIQAVGRNQWMQAKADLEQAVLLYPFSDFWKEQKRKLDEAFEHARGNRP